MSAPRARRWTTLLVAAFAMNWAWEMLQMPAYRDISQRGLGEQILLCTIASVGDVVITLAIYGAGMWLVAHVGWLSRHPSSKYVIFADLGAVAAIVGEHIALAVGLWDYGDAMPVVDFLDVGLLPLLQLTILVPVACAIALRRSGISTRAADRALASDIIHAMKPRLRKLALTAHVTFSVGWLGAVATYLAVAIAGAAGTDPLLVRSAAILLDVIGWFVIVPCSLAALLTGLVQALATEWGLFRHYWIVAKSVLTVAATAVLLGHMPTVSQFSSTAAEMTLSRPEVFDHVPVPLVVHAAGGLVVLIAITALSIYKPWGKTRWAKRAG